LLRFIILLLTAYLLALFQSAVTNEILPSWIKPDLMLILVTYLGVSPPLIRGALLVFFCGLLYETFSGSPSGLFLFTYLSVFFLIKLLAKFLILGETLRFRIILVASSMAFQSLSMIFLPLMVGILENFTLPNASWMLPQVLMTCAACWPLFNFFKKLETLPRVEPSPLES
jgi:cell shape-determining protein MreD